MSGDLLVLRALGLGDLLTAVPALRALRRAWPGHRLVLAAPEALSELVPLIGAVDEVWPTAGLAEFSWPGPPPEIAVNLHGKGPESVEALRSARAARVLTHRNAEHPDLEGPEWVADRHEVSRWCRMLGHYGIESDVDDLELSRPEESSRPGAVVVHPGASHGARRWPVERFAEVAAALAGRGERIVLTGSAAERPTAQQLAERAELPPEAVLAGDTSLSELAALVSEARLVLCGDTGLAHVATAYRTPSVTLFGPVSPAHWGPPENGRHVALWSGTTGDTFADRPDPGLLTLSADTVLEATESVLERTTCEVSR